ncbi:hypothetical protein [Cellulosimicrobium sp. Marseille-Q8652]
MVTTTRRAPRRAVHLSTVVGLALAASTLAACASSTDGGGDETASESPTDGTGGETTSEPTEGTPSMAPDAATMTVEAGATGKGLPSGVDGPTDGGAGAAWSAEPGLLYVVTYGSSTCPLLAEPDAAVQGSEVVVTFVEIPQDAVCTMDLVPATSVVAVPDDVDASAEVTAVLGDQGSVVVPPAVDGSTGEAAWVEAP